MPKDLNTESLVGRAIVIMVSEPWDYQSAYGPNRIDARIVAIDSSNDGLTAETTHEIVDEETLDENGRPVRGTQLLIHALHVGRSAFEITSCKEVGANIGLVQSGNPEEKAVFAFIGSVYLKEFETSRVVD